LSRSFTRMLDCEARWLFDKPLVYMTYPDEFSPVAGGRRKERFRLRELVPKKWEGIPLRYGSKTPDGYKLHLRTPGDRPYRIRLIGPASTRLLDLSKARAGRQKMGSSSAPRRSRSSTEASPGFMVHSKIVISPGQVAESMPTTVLPTPE
jgi:hypothetical protein